MPKNKVFGQAAGGVQYELIAVILPEVLCVSCRVRQTCYAAAEMAVA